MYDRFKFRVWSYRTQKMKRVTALIIDAGVYYSIAENKNAAVVNLNEMPHMVLMQCTGLKDKNGRLIYEGDICKIPEFSNFLFSIYFSEKDACFYAECQNGDGGATLTFSADFEVIGNIYENPELLEDV